MFAVTFGIRVDLKKTTEDVHLNNLWPLYVLKATAGGGGRGMRLAKEPEEFVKLLQVLSIYYSFSYELFLSLYIAGDYGNACRMSPSDSTQVHISFNVYAHYLAYTDVLLVRIS